MLDKKITSKTASLYRHEGYLLVNKKENSLIQFSVDRYQYTKSLKSCFLTDFKKEGVAAQFDWYTYVFVFTLEFYFRKINKKIVWFRQKIFFFIFTNCNVTYRLALRSGCYDNIQGPGSSIGLSERKL